MVLFYVFNLYSKKCLKSAILGILGIFGELFKKLSYKGGVSPRNDARPWSYSVYIVIVYP